MFDVGWSELLVIAIVLIVVVGPKDLPKMLRAFGRTTAKIRTMAGDFRRQFDEALKEAELQDLSDTINAARNINPINEIRKHLSPLEEVGNEIRAGLDTALKPTLSTSGETASAEPSPAEPLKTSHAELPGGEPAAPPLVPAADAVAPKTRKTASRKKTAAAIPAAAAAGKARTTRAPAARARTTETPPVKARATRAPASRSAKPAAAAKGAAAAVAKPAAKAAVRTGKQAPASRKKTGGADS